MHNHPASFIRCLVLFFSLASFASASRWGSFLLAWTQGFRLALGSPHVSFEGRQESQLSHSATAIDIEVGGRPFIQTTTVTETALGRLFEVCLFAPNFDLEGNSAFEASARRCVIRLGPNDFSKGGTAATSPGLEMAPEASATETFGSPSAVVSMSVLSTGNLSATVASTGSELSTVAILPAAPLASVSLSLAPSANTSVTVLSESLPSKTAASANATEPALVLPTADIVVPLANSTGIEPGLTARSSQLIPSTSSAPPLVVTPTTPLTIAIQSSTFDPADPSASFLSTVPASSSSFSLPTSFPPHARPMSNSITSSETTGVSSSSSPDLASSTSVALAAGRIDSPTSTVSSSAAATSAAMPGTQLQVLPVGLGVFAGVSVIALAVVGLVTLERRRYRKMFRSRRDAEQAALRDEEGANDPPGFVPLR